MLPAMSWMKAALSAAASFGDRGGANRVLTSPTRGALAMTAMAQVWLNAGKTRSPAPLDPGARHGGDYLEGGMRAVRLAFFEIAGLDSHLIGHMGEAQHRVAARPGKGVKRRRFHLDRQDPQLA